MIVNPILVKNILSSEDIAEIKLLVKEEMAKRKVVIHDIPIPYADSETLIKEYSRFARRDIEIFSLPDRILEKFNKLTELFPDDFKYIIDKSCITYAEYRGVYGEPSLGPHHDGGESTFMVNYQLESNIDWSVGVGKNVYDIFDNEALLFSPTEIFHWRPILPFKDDQYLCVIFLRYATVPIAEIPVIKYTEKDKAEVKHLRETYYQKKELEGKQLW